MMASWRYENIFLLFDDFQAVSYLMTQLMIYEMRIGFSHNRRRSENENRFFFILGHLIAAGGIFPQKDKAKHLE